MKHKEFQFKITFISIKKTPLHNACEKNNSEITLELLKKHDIDVNKSDAKVITNQIGLIKSKKRFILFFFL